MHKKDMFIGDAEVSSYELYRDENGDVLVMSKEEVEKHFGSMPKGTKVLPNNETASYIQSFYENRRD